MPAAGLVRRQYSAARRSGGLLAGVLLVCWCPAPTRCDRSPATDGHVRRPAEIVSATPVPAGVFPVLDEAEAWACLPARVRGTGTAPPRSSPAGGPAVDEDGLRDPDWRPADWAGVKSGMEAQKARRSRIALPADDPATNRWGLVGRTYQPALASAWAACTQAFAEEADQDPVFEQSVFWIVTRTKQCFY
ncbi:MAG: hypothetical protein K2X87_34290 [Gemmataceae bacterium]|nr:hypothetical protein [Gemmataceae bacterium]